MSDRTLAYLIEGPAHGDRRFVDQTAKEYRYPLPPYPRVSRPDYLGRVKLELREAVYLRTLPLIARDGRELGWLYLYDGERSQ